MSPILKSILEAGAAYPLLRELISFAKVDGEKLSEKAQAALEDLSTASRRRSSRRRRTRTARSRGEVARHDVVETASRAGGRMTDECKASLRATTSATLAVLAWAHLAGAGGGDRVVRVAQERA